MSRKANGTIGEFSRNRLLLKPVGVIRSRCPSEGARALGYVSLLLRKILSRAGGVISSEERFFSKQRFTYTKYVRGERHIYRRTGDA